jgi:hypothetical protein
MSARLVINGIDADIDSSIPFPISYSIADLRNPESRKRSGSKTIKLPGTRTNRKMFMNFYQIDSDSVTDLDTFSFDTTSRIEAQYYYNDIKLFDGLIRLMDVDINNGNISFNCVMFSDMINIFKQLGDLKVSELGWEEYNHTLNKTDIRNSWDTSVKVNGVDTSNFVGGNPQGFGYCYAMVDWGFNDASQKKFRTNHFIPSVYVKEAFEKCFELSGVTVDSDFMSGGAGSFLFRKLLLSYEGGAPPRLSQSLIDSLEVNASIQPNNRSYDETKTSENDSILFTPSLSAKFNSDNSTVTETLDDTNQFDTTLAEITIFKPSVVRLSMAWKLKLVASLSNYTDFNWGLSDIDIQNNLVIRKNGSVVVNSQFKSLLSGAVNTDLVSNKNFNKSVNLNVSSGDVISFSIESNKQNQKTFSADKIGSSNTVDLSYDWEFTNPFTIDMDVLDSIYEDGQTVEISRFVPNIKCTDFLKGIFTMFNLFMSDVADDNTILIEPLNEYFSSTDEFDDWTEIIDYSKPQKITPVTSLIDANKYKFEFAKDTDFLSETYFKSYGLRYGDYEYNTGNDLSSKTKSFKLPFAVTIPDEVSSNFIVPRIVKLNSSGVIEPHKGKPRIFVYNGLYSSNWKFQNSNGTGNSNETEYPQVSHLEDIDSPISDLLWTYPKFVYFNTTSYTTNNLFQYYEKDLKEKSGANAKMIELFVRLRSTDILNLDFRKLKMINGSLFKLNSIKDFDQQKDETVKVELLKVLEAKSSGGNSGGTDPIDPPSEIQASQGFWVEQPLTDSIDGLTDIATSEVLLTDNDSVNSTLTLPEPIKNQKVTIKKISPNNTPLFIIGNSGEEIDGLTTLKLTLKYESRTLIADGTNWFII